MTQSFNEQYFHEVQPRTERYDIDINDELVFCVYPNGVKAWVHIYPFENFQRRRTMGLFPETSYEATVAALPEARRIVAAETMNARRPKRRPQIRRWVLPVFTGFFGAFITWLLLFFFGGQPTPPTDTKEHRFDDDAGGSPDPSDQQDRTPTPGTAKNLSRQAEQPTDAPSLTSTDTDTDTDAIPPPGLAPTDQITDIAEAGPLAASARVNDTSQPNSEQASTADTQPPTVDPSAFLIRAQLTREIVDREPADNLPDVIEWPADGGLDLFFFTELHGLSGQTVLHRWFHEGQLRAEIPFEVGSDWRWRVYSKKWIPEDRLGKWEAEAIAANGRRIALDQVEIVPRRVAP